MKSSRNSTGLAVLAVLLFCAVGCSDATSGQDDEADSGRGGGSGVLPTGGTGGGAPMGGAGGGDSNTGGGSQPPIAGRQLSIVGDLSPTVYLGEEIDLAVKYSDVNNAPIPNAQVQAELLVNQQPVPQVEGTLLRSGTVNTDATGVATFRLVAGQISANFDVRGQAEGAMPVYWTVTVTREGTGGLRVQVEYDWERLQAGNSSLRKVGPLLFTNQQCQAMSRSPARLNGAYLAMQEVNPFNELANESAANNVDENTYSVAVQGKSATNQVVAFGCADGVVVEGGETSTISIELDDLPMTFKGVYEVENVLNLTTVFDNSGDNTLETVGTVLDVVGAIGGGVGEETRGQAIIEMVCELADLSDGTCRIVEAFGARALDALIERYVPAQILDILNIIGDVYRIVNELTIIGEFDIPQEYPDGTGLLEGNLHRWQVIRIVWRNGCMVNGMPANNPDDCSRDFSIDQLNLCENVCEVDVNGRPLDPECECVNANGRSAVSGVFNAIVQPSGELQIQEHGFTLRYGLLILGVAESWIIPAILGEDGRVSLEDLFNIWMEGPCEAINEAITGNPQDTLCQEVLIGGLTDLLREYIGRLDLDVGAFTLAGPGTIVDVNNDLVVDGFKDGMWTGRVNFGNGGIEFGGTFEACRDGVDCDPRR